MKTWSSQTTGELQPIPGTSTLQATFSVSLQLSGSVGIVGDDARRHRRSAYASHRRARGVAGFTIGHVAEQQPERGQTRSPGLTPPTFTSVQAEAGRAAYDANCSACHLRDLRGSNEAAQLAGANFLNQWGDKTIADLHAYLMASMPPGSPGSPGSQAMLDVIAYLLQANGAAAGSQPLARDAASTLRDAIGHPVNLKRRRRSRRRRRHAGARAGSGTAH